MNAASLLFDLCRRGVEVAKDGNLVRYRARKGALTPEIRDLLTKNKTAILDVLSGKGSTIDMPMPAPPTLAEKIVRLTNRAVTISGKEFVYLPRWQGEVLAGSVIAFDTETALIEGVEVPALALASASSGTEHCLIHADQVGDFILAHRDRRVVFQNVAFDSWVIVQHLQKSGATEALNCWWTMTDEGGMHDTMILDMLVKLAEHDAYPRPRDLAVLGYEYAKLEISKDDPYRLRYGEIIGKDWSSVEPGFFKYAIKDPIVTWHTYQALQAKAQALAERAGVSAETIKKYGLLSETIQVKGAIALTRITRNGMHLDLGRSGTIHQDYRRALSEIVDRLRSMPECAGLFKVSKRTGDMVMTRNQTPSLSQSVLRQALTAITSRIAAETGQPISIPMTAKGAVSISTKDWSDLAHLHPFIKDWIDMVDTAKLCQFFSGLQVPVIHPRYGILVRSGRSCASGPNIQQIPRKGGLREVFIPSPGHLLLTADYSFIELRTLAAECESRYGQSTLADVIRKGVDPHCYTAALLLGMDFAEFMAMAKTNTKRHKQLRQNAKALNFGIPGGLGPASLVQYAKATYGVELTLEQAKDFRARLINDVYPELGRYLSEDAMSILARNLRVPVVACWRRFDWKGDRSAGIVGGIRNIVHGKTCRADGQPYNPRFSDGVWNGLAAINRNPELAPLFAARLGSEDLSKKLFWSGVATSTGRLRGRVGFSQARNTPFQGMAADGAKLALWNLIRADYRIVGFVHDEVLIELPDLGGYVEEAEARKIDSIMCRSMEEVTGNVPVACEFALASCWSKDAKTIIRDGKLYAWVGGVVDER